MKKTYTCAKCGNKKAEIDKIRTTGSGFTRFINIQNRLFTAVSCSRCGYTELYRNNKSGTGGNIVDFLTN